MTRIEVWFVGNLWFPSEDAQKAAEESWTRALRAAAPRALKSRTHGKVFSTLEIVALLIERVEHMIVEEKYGRRYGDPFLNALREVTRYLNAKPSGGGRSGGSIRAAAQRRLGEALGSPMG